MQSESGSSPIKRDCNDFSSDSAPQRPEISVIIAAHNASHTLGYQLEALARQNTLRSWELIVVDDCSNDNTVEVVNAFKDVIPHLCLIPLRRHGGSAHARNLGAKEALGKLLLFCDADDIVAQDWTDRMADALANEVVAVGGYNDEYALNDSIRLTWREPMMIEGLPIGWWFLPYALTGNFGIRADVFESLGGFDESLPNGYDVDICWRLQLSGWPLGYAPLAVVYYRHRRGLFSSMKQAFKWGAVSVKLVTRFRGHGHTEPRIEPARRRLMRLVTRILQIFRGPGPRGAWLRQLAYESGIAMGWWRHLFLPRARNSALNIKLLTSASSIRHLS